jgi:hypothetical protein
MIPHTCIGSETYFWLVWSWYVPDIEISVALIEGWDYLMSLLGWYRYKSGMMQHHVGREEP